MSAPSDNMPIAVSAPRTRPLLLRHLPYFIGAAYISVPYKDAFAFLALVLFLIVRPQGIFGERVAEKA